MKLQGCSEGQAKQAFLLVQIAFVLNCTFKITPCLSFPKQFESVVSSFSANETSRLQQALKLMLHKTIILFITTIFSATQCRNIVATLFGMATTLFQHYNTVLLKILLLRIVLRNMTLSVIPETMLHDTRYQIW